MCENCGCGEALNHHSHDGHGHGHHHHESDHFHDAKGRTVKIEKSVLAVNNERAQYNRGWLAAKGVWAVNLISSPGSGKTLLLEKTLSMLKEKIGCSVIVGDQQTDNDARRLSGRGAGVCQIETGNTCHLDAERVGQRLSEVVGESTRILFIENVGNLICPAAFDLGENAKAALLSVTEGEDKPVKYPVIFSAAEIVIITKTDLTPHLDWNRDQCLKNIRSVAPGAKVFELSAKTGQGMQEWIDYLVSVHIHQTTLTDTYHEPAK